MSQERMDAARTAMRRLVSRVFWRTPIGSEFREESVNTERGPRIRFSIELDGKTAVVFRKPSVLELGEKELDKAADAIAAELRNKIGWVK